ncbi:DNA methylase N-4 [Frankia sp. R43]|uniref:DNA-methyltransferase n=1 Tax=Frankia sp. R43 TaxID=269536 RepID=UPI0006C9FF7D|nr:site-specific DNA-methyltransferase [Frankia sp. R43]KPM55404.1 DNA methylase N-4 [Frankia sp. R43]
MTVRTDQLRRNQVIVGDALTRLAELPPSCIDCVITSPPYFGLRDYGHSGQIGLESNVEAWVECLRVVAREVARVLKPGGSFWLNLGDQYASDAAEGAIKKSLLLGPQRLAVALAADGWIVRNQVIWAKTNPMPSSVADRLSPTHEVLYFLVRAPRYFFDLDAIRVPPTSRPPRPRPAVAAREYPPREAAPERSGLSRNTGLDQLKRLGRGSHPLGRNPGDVWSLATGGYRGAHFATFPIKLVQRPLLATCPEQVCAACGQPWRRVPLDRQALRPKIGQLKPDCGCDSEVVPGVVLDPFMGSGSVALCAQAHGRDWVGIELNPVYAALTRRRLADARQPQAQR